MRESERLARRDLDKPFRWDRGDELGSLGQSLENTRQSLKDLFEELNSNQRALVMDIERRARAEQELARHRAHLELIVKERTAELNDAMQRAESATRAQSA